MLDAEEPGVTVAMCVSWLQTVEAVTGIPSTVYTGGYVAGGGDLELERHFQRRRARFFAAYTSESEALVTHAQGKIWDAWQWTDKGKVAGVSTDVDCVQARRRCQVRWRRPVVTTRLVISDPLRAVGQGVAGRRGSSRWAAAQHHIAPWG